MRVFLLGFSLVFLTCWYIVHNSNEKKADEQSVSNLPKNSGMNNRLYPSQVDLYTSKKNIKQEPKQIISRRNKFAGKPLLRIKSSLYRNFSRELFEENQGKIFRWPKRRLSFYIEGNAINRLTKSKIRRAFGRWENATEKLFIFEEAFSPEKADILIRLMTTSEKNRFGEAGPKSFKLGDNFGNLREYIITKAIVIISQEHFSRESLQKNYQKNKDRSFQTLVHEIGHVLGLMAHSTEIGDCMYFKADQEAKSCNRLNTERNTLAILYGKKSLLKQEVYRN